jgi:sRNA-binding carbon storage regulator CsrA
MTNNTDQKVGLDALERLKTLRKELDERVAELNKILGK